MVQDRRSVRRASSDLPRADAPEGDTMAEIRGAARDFVGADQWKSSKTGYLTGLGALRGGFSFVGRAIGSGFGQLKVFYDAMIGRGAADDRVEGIDVDDAGERFIESMRIHGKTVEDLDRIQNSTWRGCLFFGGMTVVAVLCGLGSYIWAPNVGGLALPFDFAYRFIAVAPLAAFALKWGYVNWMVRRRRYDGLVDYLRSGEWLPQRAVRRRGGSASHSVVKRAAVVALIAGAMIALSVPQVHAQAVTSTQGMTGPQDIFKTPGDTDLFMNMLSMIAPNVGPVPGFQGQSGTATPAHTAMATGFMAFISALFFLAGMQVAWHTISGIVATANEGKVLGQRWHQIWAPVRVVAGVGFLAPALGGFCVAQVVVLYLIAFGGQLANLIWTPYVGVMVSGVATPNDAGKDAIATTIGQLSSTNDILRNVFEKELCYATGKMNYDRNKYSGGAMPSSVAWKEDYNFQMPAGDQGGIWSKLTTTLTNSIKATVNPTTTVTVSGQTLDYGVVCGKISVPVTQSTYGDSTPDVASFAPDVAAAVKFSQARKDAIDSVRGILRPIAEKAGQSYQNYQAATGGGGVANGGGVTTNGLYFSAESSGPQDGGGSGTVKELKDAFQSARAAYENAMMQAARSLMDGVGSTTNFSGQQTGGTLAQFGEDAKKGGWATAGVYYMTLSRIQSALFAKATETPIFTGMDMSQATPSLEAALMGDSPARPGAVKAFSEWASKNIAQISTSSSANEINPYGAKAGMTDIQNNNELSWLLNKLEFTTVGKMLSAVQPSPLNPMGDITNIGHSIIDAGWAALIGIAAGSAAAGAATGNIVANAFGAGSAFSAAMSIVSPLIAVMLLAVFAMGITMAFIIPMIPYIMVLFFVIGMLVLTLEAMIAAPLWAFFHVRMDGQDLVDQVQKPGYMIAFNLLLRPSLMILGYILSFFAFGAVAWFIAVTFGTATTGATAGYYGGPINFIVMGGMMAYLYYQAAVRCFTMIVQVPDRVTRWFGVGGENLGEERESHAATGMVVGNIGRRVEGGLALPTGKMISGGRPRNPTGMGPVDKPAPNGPEGQGGGGGPGGGSPRAAVQAGVDANEPSGDKLGASSGGGRSSRGGDRGGSSEIGGARAGVSPVADKASANKSGGSDSAGASSSSTSESAGTVSASRSGRQDAGSASSGSSSAPPQSSGNRQPTGSPPVQGRNPGTTSQIRPSRPPKKD